MFEMMSLRTDAGPKSLSPLIGVLVNDNWSDLNETLFQLDIIRM